MLRGAGKQLSSQERRSTNNGGSVSAWLYSYMTRHPSAIRARVLEKQAGRGARTLARPRPQSLEMRFLLFNIEVNVHRTALAHATARRN